MRRIIIAPLLALGVHACVQPATLDERRCPCTDGYRCCEAVQLCMPPEQVAALNCSPADAARADATRADAAVIADARADAAASDTAPDVSSDVATTPDAPGGLPPMSSVCENGGGGLQGTYFATAEFTDPSLTRLEPVPLFDWGEPPNQLAPGRWSALFSGQLQPSVSETFTFALGSSGGARLWVGGELLVDWWRRPFYRPFTAAMKLEAGRRYDILIEYVDQASTPRLALRWQSPSTQAGVIGQCHLIPGPGKPSPCGAGPDDCIPPGGPACLHQGKGLRVSYYKDTNFLDLDKQQVEPLVSTWVSVEDADTLKGMRWDGTLEAPVTGSYRFYLLSATTARMRLDDVEVVQARGEAADAWMHEGEGQIELSAGRHKIQVEEHFVPIGGYPADPTPPVILHLRWKPPGGPKSVIPTCFLDAPGAIP